MTFLELWELRAEFARRLSELYGREVPAYNTLVAVSADVNRDFLRDHGADAERFGSISRVTAERHGAIRLQLALQGLAFFTFRLDDAALIGQPLASPVTLAELITAGIAVPLPIVYEDFLPPSAAGIFQSDLTDQGTKDDAQTGTDFDIERMAEIVGTTVLDPNTLYRHQQQVSLDRLAAELHVVIEV